MNVKTIAIGSDHAGFELKETLIKYLLDNNFNVKDFGPNFDERSDYADYAHPVANFVEQDNDFYGILICGSGNGINMTANKHQGIRSALCWQQEIAELSRLHNNANILVLPARFISVEEAEKCVDIFFKTDFEGGRHADRVNKIACS